jgi:hypothetical protein
MTPIVIVASLLLSIGSAVVSIGHVPVVDQYVLAEHACVCA